MSISTFGRIRTFQLCATCCSKSTLKSTRQACGGVLYGPSLLPLGPALHSLPALLHHEPGEQCVSRLPRLLGLGVGPDTAQLRNPCEVFAQAKRSVKLTFYLKRDGPTRNNGTRNVGVKTVKSEVKRGPFPSDQLSEDNHQPKSIIQSSKTNRDSLRCAQLTSSSFARFAGGQTDPGGHLTWPQPPQTARKEYSRPSFDRTVKPVPAKTNAGNPQRKIVKCQRRFRIRSELFLHSSKDDLMMCTRTK